MNLVRSLRLAARSLLRARTFASVAALTLTLGVGAVVATLSVYEAILLNPLPYEDPDRLVMLWINDPEHGITEEGFGYPTYLDWREGNRVFEDVAASIRDSRMRVRVGEYFDDRYVNFTTPNLFSVLGVQPAHGRAFTQAEDDRGDAVAVVSAAFAERFGGAEAALGQTFQIHEWPHEIVGVMPAGFGFPHPETAAWIPWPGDERWRSARSRREWDGLRGIARLKPGVSVEEADRDLDALGVAIAEEHPPSATFAGYDANVVPLLEQVVGADLPRLLRVLVVGVGLLFVIAGVNLINLLLVRNEARASEASVRRALGASRWALFGGRLAESSVIAVVGLVLGTVLASFLVEAVVAWAPESLPRISEATLDPLAVLAASGLTMLVVALASSMPAGGARPVSRARGSTATGQSRRLQSAFVAGQAALALVLLCGTALFVKSFLAAVALDPGYRKEGVLLATLDYREDKPDGIHGEMVRRLREYPGVESVGGTSAFQILRNPDTVVQVIGRERSERVPLTGDLVIPGYFQTMGVPLLRGRLFREDDLGDHIAIINETMARQVWPDENPIGAVFEVQDNRNRRYEVVGVVGDMRRRGLEREPVAQMFRPVYSTVLTLAVRTDGDREVLGDWIRREYSEISPTSIPVKLETVEQSLASDLAPRRFYTALMVGFASLALALTAVGLFGLMAYVVERRTREIGVRMAVGARPADVLTMILGDGARLIAAGCALGLLVAWWSSDLLGGLLFETTTRDLSALISAAAALFLIGLLACCLPARRAALTRPTAALRSE